MLLVKETVLSLKEKAKQHYPLNITFDDFGICLLGYRIEFSYQGH